MCLCVCVFICVFVCVWLISKLGQGLFLNLEPWLIQVCMIEWWLFFLVMKSDILISLIIIILMYKYSNHWHRVKIYISYVNYLDIVILLSCANSTGILRKYCICTLWSIGPSLHFVWPWNNAVSSVQCFCVHCELWHIGTLIN